jgi:SecD/SecF fusion protein
MIRAYLGKFALIAIVVGLLGTAWALKGVQFGQDLAGGAEIRYKISSRFTEWYMKLRTWKDELNNPARVEEKKARVAKLEGLIKTATGAERARLEREKLDLGNSLDEDWVSKRLKEQKDTQEQFAQGAEIIRRRVDASGIGGIEVRTIGSSQILIRLPYQQRPDETEAEAEKRFQERLTSIRSIVETQGVLRFHIAVDRNEHKNFYTDAEARAKEGEPISEDYLYVLPQAQYDEVAKKLAERDEKYPINAGYLPWSKPPAKAPGARTDPDKRKPLLLNRKHGLDGSIIDRAYTRIGQGLNWAVSLGFTASGSGQFERVTGANVGKQLAIILDGVCHSAPNISEQISGSAEITGSFTAKEAGELATVLTAGSLPVQIELESESVVGPSLGRDSIRSGLSAAGIGAGLVVLFMLVYYLSGGVVANIALALNLVMIMGALAAFNAKLTLPGIAGLVLTIGMAVDANVLIFERIREEKARGRPLRLAVQAGYDRAFITIIDANITTLITAIILYWFGTGPVRGFAVTLTLGILGSLFASLYASRAIIEFLVGKEWISKFTMLRIVGKSSISFMRARGVAYVVSILLVAGGLTAFFTYRDKYGIDFEGGTMVTVVLDDKLSDEDMRAAAEGALAEMQSNEVARATEQGRETLDFGNVRVQALEDSLAAIMGGASRKYSLIMRMDVHDLENYKGLLTERLGEKLADDGFPSQASIGQAVSEELGSAAIGAIIFSIILIFLYIIMRFEFNPSFGVGAVVALAHDLAITAGAMALADRLGLIPAKIDLPAVAALLTIVGYSLNDTIVVFDRIREAHVAAGHKKPLKDVVDEAVNGVLSRTLITSLTTLLAAGSLLILGGDATRGFSFAILVGVLVGTYSSVFVASPIVVEWESFRQKPGLKRAALIFAGVLAVAALGGLITQSVLTARDYERRDACSEAIEDLSMALGNYAAKHAGEYPRDLADLVTSKALSDGKALRGPDVEVADAEAYDYIAGLRSGDDPNFVMAYDRVGLHGRGGHLLFVDGRVSWKDRRNIIALVASTMEEAKALPERKVSVVRAARPGGK